MNARTTVFTAAAVAVLVAGAAFALMRASAPGATAPAQARPADPHALMQVGFIMRDVDHAGAEAFSHAGLALSLAGFGERFGAPLADITLVSDFLSGAGLTVLPVGPQRLLVQATGDVATVERLLNLKILDVPESADSLVTRHQADRLPAVPAAIADKVAAVVGLGRDERPQPAAPTLTADVPNGAMSPQELRKAYGFDKLFARGIDGSGQTIAIASWGTFRDTDLQTWMKNYGGDPGQVTKVSVPDGATIPINSASGEVNLDVQAVLAVAPKAKVVDFEGAGSIDWPQLFEAILGSPHNVSAISVSYGYCELNEDKDPQSADRNYYATVRQATDTQLAAAESAGVNVFVSSGDVGAFTCDHNYSSAADLSPAVAWPASSDHVLSVGGTYLRLRADGTYYDESAWEGAVGFLGTGGGRSLKYQKPAWQSGAGIAAGETARMLPDIAGPADANSGLWVYCQCNHEDPADGWSPGNGTSQAAPIWAGYSALLRQGVEAAGALRTVGQRQTLKDLPKALYELAASNPANPLFHDITSGGNLEDGAGPGWDSSTGLGSPVGDALFDAIVSWYQTNTGQ